MTILMHAPNGTLLDRPGTMLAIRPDAPAGIPIDAIDCAVARADAILTLVMGQFQGDGPAEFSNAVIVNSIWAVQGLLAEIGTLANNREIELK